MKYDAVIIGAGAAGLLCAATAGAMGKNVLLVDHAKRPGKKILISGGGRCNFTNYYIEPEKYLCENPHFCKSALSQYTQWDFIALVEKHNIKYHEKTLGQLFCDDSAKEIVAMLVKECEQAKVTLQYQSNVTDIQQTTNGFSLFVNEQSISCKSLVIASGGLSMPKLGATPFAYKVAEQFGLDVLPTRAGLVPFTLHQELKESLGDISGVSVPVIAGNERIQFNESMLITHRGLSGPSILQISSYWQPGETIYLDLYPSNSFDEFLEKAIGSQGNQTLKNTLAEIFAKRFADKFIELHKLDNVPIKQLTHATKQKLNNLVHKWEIQPNGTEGYRTAEVTLGGVDTDQLSSKTMQVKGKEGLFFIGESVDVTGWLGGYNFQWAWSSGYVAAQHV